MATSGRRRVLLRTWALIGTFVSGALAGAGEMTSPADTTLCELYRNPQRYTGTMVRLRATIVGYKRRFLALPTFTSQHECPDAYMSIALELPSAVRPNPGFVLNEDAQLKDYEKALQRGMRVEATLEGRFDAVRTWYDGKRVRVGPGEGFGADRKADGRIILKTVREVRAEPLPRR
jgi:hypothetical protein